MSSRSDDVCGHPATNLPGAHTCELDAGHRGVHYKNLDGPGFTGSAIWCVTADRIGHARRVIRNEFARLSAAERSAALNELSEVAGV